MWSRLLLYHIWLGLNFPLYAVFIHWSLIFGFRKQRIALEFSLYWGTGRGYLGYRPILLKVAGQKQADG